MLFLWRRLLLVVHVVNVSSLPVVSEASDARPVHVVRQDALTSFLAGLPSAQAAYLSGAGFSAKAQELALIPDETGVCAAVLGLGKSSSHISFGDLAFRLPEGVWKFVPGNFDMNEAVLGFCLGGYRFTMFKPPSRKPATLVTGGGHAAALSQAASIWMARNLVNTPANLLGPNELAEATAELAETFDARFTRVEGEGLATEYPTVAAVGNGSDRKPVVARFEWRGSKASDTSKLVSLCGKGVVFDTGGYDLKPPSGMLYMKKDMGGAASVLALARIIMEADLPIRLSVRIGCVENSVSGGAMRPLDVVRTRRGLAVEIGNTDAEGRLVLCDLFAEASDENPDLLVDYATLTGAARVALGPDLPALFCTDTGWTDVLMAEGRALSDPMWPMPLWNGYERWLDSNIADLNNVSGKSHAGAIVASLFMQRFITASLERGTVWAHFDTLAWNESSRPGRPEGGEALAVRSMFSAITKRFVVA
jgi:leucyl aminopeptidase